MVERYIIFYQINSSTQTRSPGHVECLFDSPDEKFLPRSRKIFRPRYEKIFKFFRDFFPHYVPLDTQKSVMTTLVKFSCRECQFFQWKYENDKKIDFPRKKLLLTLLPWTKKLQWGQPCWSVSFKVLKKPASKSKDDQKEHIFFPEIVCPQNVRLDTQIAILTSLPKFFYQKTDRSSLIFRKWWKKSNFSKTNPQLFLWTRKIHIWQPWRISFSEVFLPSTFLWIPRNPLWRHCWSFFARSTKFVTRITKMNQNKLFQEKIFLLRPFQWTREMHFGQPWWNILVRVQNMARSPKLIKKNKYVFQKK